MSLNIPFSAARQNQKRLQAALGELSAALDHHNSVRLQEALILLMTTDAPAADIQSVLRLSLEKLDEWASTNVKISVTDIIYNHAQGNEDYLRMADDYFLKVMVPLETQTPLYALRIFTNVFTDIDSSPFLMAEAEAAVGRITHKPHPVHALPMLRYLVDADSVLTERSQYNEVLFDQMIHLGNILKDENPDDALSAYLRVLDSTASDHPRLDDLSLKVISLAHKIMPTYTDIARRAVEIVKCTLDPQSPLHAEIDSLMAEPHVEDGAALSLTAAEFMARYTETVTVVEQTPVITP